MPKKRKSMINIKAIQKEFGLPFLEVMTIVRDENWRPVDGRGMNFDREIVYNYFSKNRISPKTINYKQIMEQFGVSKKDVFKLISENKWQPVSTRGLWAFPYAPIAEFFATKK